MAKDNIAPVNAADSPSPSIRRGGQATDQWRRGGDQAAEALKNNPLKNPIDPSTNK